MDPLAARILREYQIVLDTLIERELLLDTNPLSALESRNQTTLTWTRGAHLSYLFEDYQRLSHYQAILEARDFSLCMIDGGVLQVHYDIEDERIIRHRLSYFPCPFSFTDEERGGFALSELPALFGPEEMCTRIKLITPVRFDYDADFKDRYHTNSHVTLNRSSCRIPAYGPISLGHFIRFVLRYFYESEFSLINEWEEVRPRLYFRTLSFPPPHEVFVETAADY